MKKPAQHFITEVPRRRAKIEMMIGIELGDVFAVGLRTLRTVAKI